MRIVNKKESPNEPVAIEVFLYSGEYDQGDVALISYDDIYDYLHAISKALDTAGVAIGNEHETYTLAQRIEWLAAVKDSLARQVDELRIREKSRFRKAGDET